MADQRKVTGRDLEMIIYFWQEKEDLERYCSWKEIQDDLRNNYPHILDAWLRYKSAITTLNSLVEASNPDELQETAEDLS